MKPFFDFVPIRFDVLVKVYCDGVFGKRNKLIDVGSAAEF